MAFQKKMMKIMELENNKRDLSSIKECHDAYTDFVESLRRSFSSPEYESNASGGVLEKCIHSIHSHSKEEIQDLWML